MKMMGKDRKRRNKKRELKSVFCGKNFYYQIGTSTTSNNNNNKATINNNDDDEAAASTETDYASTLPWKDTVPLSAACSAQSTIVLTEKGKIYQVGTMHGRIYKEWTKLEIPLPLKCVEISAGRHFGVARMEGGRAVLTWGAGHFGQLGVVKQNNDRDHESNNNNSSSTLSFAPEPVLVERLLPINTGVPIRQVAAGDWHCLALSESGQVWAWGSNRCWQCGHKPPSQNASTLSLPLPIPNIPAMKQIAAGRLHSCGITSNGGQIYCWGSSSYGQCGTVTRRGVSGVLPTEIDGIPGMEMIQIAAGGQHCIALSKAGRVFCWGDGREGQLGVAMIQSSKPRLNADLDFVAIAAGQEIKNSASTSPSSSGSSTAAENLSKVPRIISIYASANSSMAISSSGHVYSWGCNDIGHLGIPQPSEMLVCSDEVMAISRSEDRNIHIKTFDSDHNIMFPIRLQALADIEITKLALGPNHMCCFGEVRADDDNVVVGRTLHEIQQDHKRKAKDAPEGNGGSIFEKKVSKDDGMNIVSNNNETKTDIVDGGSAGVAMVESEHDVTYHVDEPTEDTDTFFEGESVSKPISEICLTGTTKSDPPVTLDDTHDDGGSGIIDSPLSSPTTPTAPSAAVAAVRESTINEDEALLLDDSTDTTRRRKSPSFVRRFSDRILRRRSKGSTKSDSDHSSRSGLFGRKRNNNHEK